jgi:dTDP-4-dehydrorhamnose 3,5-epimerase
MPFIQTDFPGLMIFEPKVFEDSRGYFFESYNENTCKAEGVNIQFVQDNQAKSSYGVIRGLHYQLAPFSQTKFIRVLTGAIIDAVVDLRKGSPTFGKSFSIELNAANHLQLLVPKGFAHGYSVISETAEVFYKCDTFYHKDAEAGIMYNDDALKIDWKIPVEQQIISEKDQQHPLFANCLNNFEF